MNTGAPGMIRGLVPGRGRSTRDALVVAALLTTSLGAVKVGQRRRDPGLQSRFMASRLVRGRT